MKIYENYLISKINEFVVNDSFNLIDYKNSYFTSNDVNKIIEFYKGFQNKDELVRWMRERPKGVYKIHEVNGSNEIIVVIPTADFNGKYAKQCRENIYKGMHIIFVESSIGNYYFNYAHNCNVGIRRAMEYNPKWVIVSNDDMKEIDSSETLRSELLNEEFLNYDVLFTEHNPRIILSSDRRYIQPLASIIYYGLRRQFKLTLNLQKIRRKFLINKTVIWKNSFSIVDRLIYKEGINFVNNGDFVCLGCNYIKSKKDMFDSTFINGNEDYYLSINIRSSSKWRFLSFKIDGIGGASMSFNKHETINRTFRTQCNNVYLEYLLSFT